MIGLPRRRKPQSLFEVLLMDELVRSLTDPIAQPLLNVLLGRLSSPPRDDREAPRMQLPQVEQQGLSSEVMGASLKELQRISFDQAREEVSRTFMVFRTQRIEARIMG